MPAESRITRLNAQLLKELAQLGEVHIRPDIPDAFVTFTGVELSSNLRTARVFVSVYGGEDAKRRALALLQRKRPVLQQGIARKILMKYTPVLHFTLDETAERAERVMSILQDLNLPEEDGAAAAPPATPPDSP